MALGRGQGVVDGLQAAVGDERAVDRQCARVRVERGVDHGADRAALQGERVLLALLAARVDDAQCRDRAAAVEVDD